MSIAAHRSAVAEVATIRSRFPALERRQGGANVAYFDGPGGTQVPREVVAAMSDYLYRHNANTHWAFPTSQETDQALADARQALADLFNASPGEIVFGANMTTLTFHLARSLGRNFQAGDEIVTTELDHHANIDPWRALEVERGVVVRQARMIAETGQIDWDHLESLIGERTRLLAVGAASNALGTINDLNRASRAARAAGAMFFVDAVHYAPHGLVDVRAIDCDFLACSAYKFYGPHVGVLYGKYDLLQAIDAPKLRPASDAAPDRLETGTLNHEGIVGAAAAVDFLASLAQGSNRRARLEAVFEVLHERGQALVERLWRRLGDIRGARVYGPRPSQPRTPTVSFAIDGHPSAEVAARLADKGIYVSNGDFYATTAVDRLGHSRDGLVRVGCACYTTDDEIARLLDGIGEIART
jgi:cysteine desulfurase family protein (TIGR01976 family)